MFRFLLSKLFSRNGKLRVVLWAAPFVVQALRKVRSHRAQTRVGRASLKGRVFDTVLSMLAGLLGQRSASPSGRSGSSSSRFSPKRR